MRRPPLVMAGLALPVLFGLGQRPLPVAAQTPPPLSSQSIDELKKTALKVFIDCDDCDLNYIKTEITFVNYVRDRLEAQVHVLITIQSTGGGGREYTLSFIGQNECKDLADVQKYFSSKTDTEDEIRKGLVKALKMGLMSYVARTPIARRIAVEYAKPEAGPAGRNRWNSWVFSLSADGHFSGEQSYRQRYISGNFSANRVTSASKLKLGLSVDTERQRFETETGPVIGSSSSYSASGLYVKSLGEHWSAGGFVEVRSSLYRNIDLGLIAAPAVEYDFFPYSQSTRRQLRALYRFNLAYANYREVTVFGKLRQFAAQQVLTLALDLREKLGTISVEVDAQNYLQDFARYRVNTFSMISLRLYKGLSFYVLGGYSWIHDQINLMRREATYEELLLRLRELPMNDNYFVAVGLQFQFGSIFTNVINPRFGSSGSGGLTIRMN